MIIYDDTRIGNKPSNPLPGLETIQLVNFNTALLQKTMLQSRLGQFPDSVPVVLGMENNTYDESLEFLAFAKDTLQSLGLQRPISVYGQFPREYWSAIRYREQPQNTTYAKSYLKWIDSIQEKQELYKQLDFLCPSVYTFYPAANEADQSAQRWKIFATENIAIAKAFDKPVYPYLMINYHPAGVLLPDWFIEFQLRIVESMKVECMIWFSSNQYNWLTSPNIQDWYNVTTRVFG